MDIVKQLDELGTYTVPEQNEIRWKAMHEIERLREALKDMDGYVSRADRYYLKPETLAALKEKE